MPKRLAGRHKTSSSLRRACDMARMFDFCFGSRNRTASAKAGRSIRLNDYARGTA